MPLLSRPCRLLIVLLAAIGFPDSATAVSPSAQELAKTARVRYAEATIEALAQLVRFPTFKVEELENRDNKHVQAMTAYLKSLAGELELEFTDYGDVVVIALGDSEDRLGIVTHGDVQPADASKWAADPFSLDLESEPGRLVARGVEDDKGPIACAMYAMKTLDDAGIPLRRRVELIISYTEESNWQPFRDWLASNPPPQLNVAIDAEYPVVVGEKGWCMVYYSRPALPPTAQSDLLVRLTGGAFLSQVPADAQALIRNPSPGLLERIRGSSDIITGAESTEDGIVITARGKAAHSSKPDEGINAITHLSEALGDLDLPRTHVMEMVDFVNARLGTGYLARKMGDAAYEHPIMGPLTLSLSTMTTEEHRITAAINLRRPAGRDAGQVRQSIVTAVRDWEDQAGLIPGELRTEIYEPHYLDSAPHIPVLIDIFQHYTGSPHAEPISIGGGTHARLMPAGVNFGPSMPGEPYTGHSEHEYMSREQFLLNLEMYTAMLAELAGPEVPASEASAIQR